MKCMFQIELVDFVIKNPGSTSFDDLEKALNSKDSTSIEKESFKIAEEFFPIFLVNLEKLGWSYAYTQFSPNQFKYSFKKIN